MALVATAAAALFVLRAGSEPESDGAEGRSANTRSDAEQPASLETPVVEPSHATARIGAERDRPAAPGHRSAIDRQATDSAAGAEVAAPDAVDDPSSADSTTYLAQFQVDDASALEEGSGGQFEVLVAPVAQPDSPVRSMPWSDGGPSLRLPPGDYEAAIAANTHIVGPTHAFTVDASDLRVTLTPPNRLTFQFTVVEQDTREPIAGASVELTRQQVEVFGADRIDQRSVVTDGSGFVRFEDVAFGTWNLSAIAEGYATTEAKIELPGQWSDDVTDDGVLDIDVVRLTETHLLRIQLEGYREWGGADGFQIMYPPDATYVPFDSDGLAVLPLGWYSEPLLLEFDYPGEQEGVLYLDAGMPEEDEALVIDVRRDRGIEVDVQFAASAPEEIRSADHAIRITCRTPRGDSFMCGRELSDAGVFDVYGIPADYAVAALASKIDDRFVELATDSVVVANEGLTPSRLVVTGPPRTLRLVDTDGQPIKGFYVEIREVPDRTSWLSGGPTDDRGEIAIPDTSALRYGLRAANGDERTMIVDRTVTLAPNGAVTELVVDYGAPSHVLATIDGSPADGVKINLFGALSETPYGTLVTVPDGTTPAWRIDRTSTPRVQVVETDYWTATPTLELQEGENRIDLYSVGTIELIGDIDPANIRHSTLGANVAQWISAGLIDLSPEKNNVTLMVPTGHYVVARHAGTTESFDLVADGIASIGADFATVR